MKTPLRPSWLPLALGAVLALQACSKEGATQDKKRAGQPPAPVLLGKVESKAMPREVAGFGAVEANVSVAVKSLVTGPIASMHFTRGQSVREGDLLYRIDPRPFEATLRQLEANRARDQAQFENARKEAARQAELKKRDFSSQEALDQATAALESLTATLKADEAALEQARIQLEYCSIKSPVAGRTGTTALDPGNVVKANEATLVTILQVQPVKVVFSLTEADMRKVAAAMAAGKVQVTTGIASASDSVESGELTAIDNAIDPATGMIRLEASFPNASGRLWPGQFVTVAVSLGAQQDAVVVPSEAVQTGQKGAFVFVFSPATTNVAIRPVTVDRVVGGETVIARGLNPGEDIVTDGQLRLRSGSQVVIRQKPAAQPGATR